jgi:hypothetical protein
MSTTPLDSGKKVSADIGKITKKKAERNVVNGTSSSMFVAAKTP